MNNVQLIGRMTKDPNTTFSKDGKAVTRFTLACDRWSKDAGADFIGCVAFNKTAEFIDKYFRKGMKMALTGSIRTGNYTKDNGDKVYTTDVVADRVEFVEKKADAPVMPGHRRDRSNCKKERVKNNADALFFTHKVCVEAPQTLRIASENSPSRNSPRASSRKALRHEEKSDRGK